jgi:hypothetical protein
MGAIKLKYFFGFKKLVLPNKQITAQATAVSNIYANKMAGLLEQIQLENAELRATVVRHSEKIDHCSRIIYQLLGGLFNQETQNITLAGHISVLLDKDEILLEAEKRAGLDMSVDRCERGWNDESIWPTTRQGDQNEKRIKYLEGKLQQLEEQVLKMEKLQLAEMSRRSSTQSSPSESDSESSD